MPEIRIIRQTYRLRRTRAGRVPLPKGTGLSVQVRDDFAISIAITTFPRGWRTLVWRIRYRWARLLDRVLWEPPK